jgi:hypothetical protein
MGKLRRDGESAWHMSEAAEVLPRLWAPRLEVLDHLAARRQSQGLVGEIVGGRPQTAGADHQIRPCAGLRKGDDEASSVVLDGRVAVDRNNQSREPAAEPSRVRVHETPEKYLCPNGHDLGAHQLTTLHAISPKASFTAVSL